MSGKVRYAFHVRRAGAGLVLREGTAPALAQVGRVPRVARLLALAHKFQGMLDRGEVRSMAEIARVGHVTRARVTQIMDLLLLAPDIQEAVLFLPAGAGGDSVTMRVLQAVVREVRWGDQRRTWRVVRSGDERRIGA